MIDGTKIRGAINNNIEKTPKITRVRNCLLVSNLFSLSTHSCKFVSIDGVWCWDSDLKISDKMEYQHEPKPTVTTLTKVALVEGLEIDLVSCSASGTTHKVKKIESFVISNDKLSPSLERKIKFIEHR